MKVPGVAGGVVAVEVIDAVAVGGDHHGLVLSEFDGLAGELDEGGDIGADEHLAVPTPTTSGVDRRAATMVPGSSAWANTSVKWPSSRRSTANTDATEVARGQALPVGAGDQVHRDLGVGVAGELHPMGFQFVAQRREVLDDAVVHGPRSAGGVAGGGVVSVADRGGLHRCPDTEAAPAPAGRSRQRPSRVASCRPLDGAPSSRPCRPGQRCPTSQPRYSIRRSASITTSRYGRCPDVADDSAHGDPGSSNGPPRWVGGGPHQELCRRPVHPRVQRFCG